MMFSTKVYELLSLHASHHLVSSYTESDEEGSMQAFEQNYDKVTKDFEAVAPSLAQHDLR